MKEISISTSKRVDLVDITSNIEGIIRQSKTREGICHIFIPHTTCGVLLNENADPSVKTDIIESLERMVPSSQRYRHAEGNSPAHVKASMMGHSINIFIKNGNLCLGTWQGVYLCEFDGPRRRKVFVNFSASIN